MPRLQAEVDAAIPPDDDTVVTDFDTVKDLPYLHSTINETLRIHSTSSLGLPRVVPPGPGIQSQITIFFKEPSSPSPHTRSTTSPPSRAPTPPASTQTDGSKAA